MTPKQQPKIAAVKKIKAAYVAAQDAGVVKVRVVKPIYKGDE